MLNREEEEGKGSSEMDAKSDAMLDSAGGVGGLVRVPRMVELRKLETQRDGIDCGVKYEGWVRCICGSAGRVGDEGGRENDRSAALTAGGLVCVRCRDGRSPFKASSRCSMSSSDNERS